MLLLYNQTIFDMNVGDDYVPLLKLKENPMLCSSLDWRGVWGRMDPYICLADSLCYSSKNITEL